MVSAFEGVFEVGREVLKGKQLLRRLPLGIQHIWILRE